MAYQTYHLLLDSHPHIPLLFFVFYSTVCSYNFHWYLTAQSVTSKRRVVWTQHHKPLHLFLYLIGLSGSVFYFFLLKDHWLAIFFGALVTFLYSAPKIPQTFFRSLKRIAVGKTLFLAFVWMYATTILPIAVSGSSWKPPFTLFAISRFLLVYAICILFDYRDRADDKKEGIRSMITYFNEKGINTLFFLSLLGFAAVTVSLYRYSYSFYSIVLLLIPGLLAAALYSHAKKNFSDYLYYFVLDGLMMLSSLLMLVARI
jgi:4-hydroxybenzoate polyprenyltransferase